MSIDRQSEQMSSADTGTAPGFFAGLLEADNPSGDISVGEKSQATPFWISDGYIDTLPS
jgi:hypothetical protein